jgi:hypothetical protein
MVFHLGGRKGGNLNQGEFEVIIGIEPIKIHLKRIF